jgi:hypothetical protein
MNPIADNWKYFGPAQRFRTFKFLALREFALALNLVGRANLNQQTPIKNGRPY